MHKLFVVSTPIGNLEDITIRAIKTLLTVPTIACEDTRHTGILLKLLQEKYAEKFNIQCSKLKKFVSVRDFNEVKQLELIIKALQENDVALVSDAGTPLISDPGYKLVNVVKAAGFEVVPIPGVSALTTALSVAGLPTNKAVFWGFYEDNFDFDLKATNVFYESPKRIEETLEKIKIKYKNTNIIIANEMTKIYERFLKPDEIKNIKGEITVLVNFDR